MARPPLRLDRGLVVLDRDPGRFLFAAWQNISIIVWMAQMDVPATERLKDAMGKVAAEYPEGRSSLAIVSPGVPVPTDEEARARLIEMVNRAGGQLAALAIVARRVGFERSAFMSYHTNLRLATSGSSDIGFFDSLDEVARWLPERHAKTGVVIDPAKLIDHCEHAFDLASRR